MNAKKTAMLALVLALSFTAIISMGDVSADDLGATDVDDGMEPVILPEPQSEHNYVYDAIYIIVIVLFVLGLLHVKARAKK